jgi:GT2 family glycosyltransferase
MKKTKDKTMKEKLFWASGACFFIRSYVYKELMGLMIFFAHQEEIDLCWRAINRYSIKYNYKSTGYHVVELP